jgi:hypothetical protein
MTRSITPITAASNGGEPHEDMGETLRPGHGLAVLRHKEGLGLISLACDALTETFDLAHEMHAQLYAKDPADDRQVQQLTGEALTCLQTAEHYLLMLGSVLEERATAQGEDPDPGVDPWSVEPAF